MPRILNINYLSARLPLTNTRTVPSATSANQNAVKHALPIVADDDVVSRLGMIHD